MAVSLSLFAATTFFRDYLNGWVGEGTCNILFFVSLVLTVLSFGIASFRKEKPENELVILATLGWFLLWVGLSRGAVRNDFLVGMPLAYGTAWLLWISPAHLIQKLKDMEIVYQRIQDQLVTTTVTIIVLILVLFSPPLGGHAHMSVHAARMRPPVPWKNSHAEAYKWMKDTLPQESIMAAHWNFGIQLNVLGNVGTIIDPDQFIKRIYLFYRHVCCAQDEQEALSFLKTYEVTHLMLMDQDMISRSRNYSSIGSDENGDRKFRTYRLTRIETPIGTPHRMLSRNEECLLSFIDISRPTPETLAIAAKFRDESDTDKSTAQTLDERQKKTPGATVQNVVSNFTSQIFVDIENGGVVLYLDPEIRLQRAYYIPPIGWNSLTVKLFRSEHSEAFVPVYPTDEDANRDAKVWEIHYPPDIETNEKYLTTKWEQTKTNKADKQ